ncbi:hypothetical protein FF38_00836 [Lucilia cuprina]|uniref:SMP-30/Gluconolactonase/LRE-like region domain-containing protein n=1 Tax=Lucilia cuprina TaxID=7375 RepID=A0A0L0CR29_LUCCU|nr:hypothetical protein FF38_00836 [Lucilia cuprina]
MYKFDFDLEKGEISKQAIVKDFRGTTIEPDGLVIDKDGNLWTALMGHGKVLKLDPNGNILQEVIVPTPDVTCPAWGDANNSTLYITTASFASKEGGHVYKLKTDVSGMSNFEFAG